MCRTLLAVPVGLDPSTQTVEVAAVDPFDPHVAREFAFHLKCPVRIVRGPLCLVQDALRTIEDGSSGPEAVDELQESDIIEQAAEDGIAMDERGEPILSLRASKVPRVLDMRSDPVSPTRGSGAHSQGLLSYPPPAPRTSDLPAQTAPGPFSPEAPRPPFGSIEPDLDALREAATRDEVMHALIRGMSTIARRVGLLAIRKGAFWGVKCNRRLCDPLCFKQLAMGVDAPTVLAAAAVDGSYLGPLPDDTAHEPLLALVGRSGGEAALTLVRIAGRPAMLIYADDLGDTLIATRRAEELARAAGEALSRIVTEGKERARE
jgi:hypothetical protein